MSELLLLGCKSGCGAVNTCVPFGIALVNVLEDGGTLLLVECARVDARQAGVENVFDGEFELCAGRGLLPPVENKQLFEPVQQFAGDFLDLGAFVGA